MLSFCSFIFWNFQFLKFSWAFGTSNFTLHWAVRFSLRYAFIYFTQKKPWWCYEHKSFPKILCFANTLLILTCYQICEIDNFLKFHLLKDVLSKSITFYNRNWKWLTHNFSLCYHFVRKWGWSIYHLYPLIRLIYERLQMSIITDERLTKWM